MKTTRSLAPLLPFRRNKLFVGRSWFKHDCDHHKQLLSWPLARVRLPDIQTNAIRLDRFNLNYVSVIVKTLAYYTFFRSYSTLFLRKKLIHNKSILKHWTLAWDTKPSQPPTEFRNDKNSVYFKESSKIQRTTCKCSSVFIYIILGITFKS